ncbi:hypothetical protein GJ744_010160 [Endocarpon pusillum]|uniref:GPI mannosyltransferase 2 n=1 Tax=Endocarpon pusillum TaxID=364733 RepID=A0A8H7E5P2_9EURO|nr:hypothetical protein GJ744_010160 [Endocarpon pusillum]
MLRVNGGEKTPLPHSNSMQWQDIRLLVVLFCIWKVLLFSIIVLAPGPGYDTSSTLLVDAGSSVVPAKQTQQAATSVPLVWKIVRWDAIYFTQITRRGYVFEQEWAFGPGFPTVVGWLQRGLFTDWFRDKIFETAILGVALSNLCHLLSVLLLPTLTMTVFSKSPQSGSSLPKAVAALHIINPAGGFLLSPCPEALFSFLNFLGFHLYLKALRIQYQKRAISAEIHCLAAGAVFGLATTVRSNGLLSGALFLYDATLTARHLLSGDLSVERFRRLIVVGVGGCLIALGVILPQFRAYARYCNLGLPDELRPWCNEYVPSIYAWVQRHYWNVGLFRYWTVSNIPLFLLAAPTIFILNKSAIWAWKHDSDALQDGTIRTARSTESDFQQGCLRRLATPQAMLALLALLSYHVQIITRLSSAYPLWYIWLYSSIRAGAGHKGRVKSHPIDPQTVVRWMVLYAVVQATLYASFLPPA